jgi:cyanophycinase
MVPKGKLIAIGGNEDKGFGTDEKYTLDFVESGILRHVVNHGGGPGARIEVIPTASSIPAEVGANYQQAFTKLGCESVGVLDIRNKKKVNDPSAIERIKQADIVMFSGGDQRRLSKIYRGSEIINILHRRYMHEKIVIAGTSAGAVAMSATMIFGGSAAYALLKGAVKLMPGLGFIDNVIFDSHFVARGRFGRLSEAIAMHPDQLGFGLGEDTGVVVTDGNKIQVIGSGMVIIFDGCQLTHNNAAILEAGTPMSIGNMIIHVLANGDEFDLAEKTVKVLAMEKEFV